MALKKHAHQLFTDREEPRQAFWNTLRKVEENPGSSGIITYYGEGGIGKSWLLADIKRRVEYLNPESGESFFDDGFVFRGEYIPVLYNLETSTDPIEILCHLRYSFFQADEHTAFPIFDCAIKKYKEITHKNLVTSESSGISLAGYEKALDLGTMAYSGLGRFKDFYGVIKMGADLVLTARQKYEDHITRNLYREYLEDIAGCRTAEDIRDNIAEYFKADLNLQDRDVIVVFLIDTFEMLTYKTGLTNHAWLTEELAKETENTVWVFAGRNRIYKDSDNEHLIGDLSREDTEYYLRRKQDIADENIIQKIWEIAGGTPIFLDICVQNYRNEGYPSTDTFRNLNKELLLKRYVKYLSDGERLIIRLMSSMGHWTDEDFREVFNIVHNGSFSQYHESYNKVITTTMVEKDNEDRYFLHRSVRAGILEDPGYPEEIRWDSQYAMLDVYGRRSAEYADPIYYASRFIDLTKTMADHNETFDDEAAAILAYSMIFITEELYARGREPLVSWFSDQIKGYIEKLNHSEISDANISLFLANAAYRTGSIHQAGRMAFHAAGMFRRLNGKADRSTIFAERIMADCSRARGRYQEAADQLEKCLKKYRENYTDKDPDHDVAVYNVRSQLINLKGLLDDEADDSEKTLEDEIAEYGWHDSRTLIAALSCADQLSRRGRHAEAMELMEKAYPACLELNGPKDQTPYTYLNRLALFCSRAGQKEKARKLAEDGLKAAYEEFGEDSAAAALMLAVTGLFKEEERKYGEALDDYLKALDIYGRMEGETERAEATDLLGLTAGIYARTQKYEEAYQYYCQAYERLEKGFESDYPELLNNLSMQGICLLMMDENDRARELCEDGWRKAVGKGEKLTKTTYQTALNLAAVYQKLGIENGMAEQVYRYIGSYSRNVLNNPERAAQFDQLAKAVHKNLRS